MIRSKLSYFQRSNPKKNFRKLDRDMRQKWRDVTQAQEKQAQKPPKCYMQHIPSIYDAALQNQQAKACWKCCKTPRKVTEIFCVYTENFQPTNMIDKM